MTSNQSSLELAMQELKHCLQEVYFKSVPSAVRVCLRGRRGSVVFLKAIKTFQEAPEAYSEPGNPVLADLIYGWGNEAWSARDEYLAACIQQTLRTDGAILECGSGLSSILVAVIAQQRNLTHIVLEHKPEWAAKVQAVFDRFGLNSVLHICPLKHYGAFDWYEVDSGQLPDSFSLVVCDGPPGRTLGGRYGLLSIMREKLRPGSVILLDDGYRKEEIEIAQRWSAETGATVAIKGKVKPYIHIGF